MPLNPVGAASQVDAIKRTADKLNQILGDRIGDASIVLQPDTKMKPRKDGGPSFGFWNKGPRRVDLWDEIDEYPVIKTLAHEAMHVLDEDWLTGQQRIDIRAQMEPTPQTWKDFFINGKPKKYVALPYETFAVYASKAIGDLGFARPAYRGIFIRKIKPEKMDDLRDIIDRDTDGGTRGGADEDIENVPFPPDTVDELQELLTETERKLSSAKAKASKIGTFLAQGDINAAKSKVSEIEAL